MLDSVSGADDLQFDAPTGQMYFVGTTGTVAVFQEVDPDHFQLLGKVPTGAISKTGLWVPELKRFYSAVPRHYILTAPPWDTRLPGRSAQRIEHCARCEVSGKKPAGKPRCFLTW